MTAARILDGLERLDLTGDDAIAAARLGLLEWIFAQPGAVTAVDAREALNMLARRQAPESDAGRAFLYYLREASLPVSHRRARDGRPRPRHLH